MSAGFNRLLDAVVRIDVRDVTFEPGARRFVAGVGSGVILSNDGLVLTNAHVASPMPWRFSITLPSLESVGASSSGGIIGLTWRSFRLDSKRCGGGGWSLRPAAFGDSSALYPGEVVYAVGTPYG